MALGDPQPSFTWMFVSLINNSHTEILNDSLKHIINFAMNTTLILKSVQYEDSGWYVCNVSNKVDSVLENGTLNVEGESSYNIGFFNILIIGNNYVSTSNGKDI